MISPPRLVAGTGALVLVAAMLPTAAFAQAVVPTGTAADTAIRNEATLTYAVANVAQQDVRAETTFRVDRKVSMILDEVANLTTTVAPAQQNAVTTFTLQNLTNAPLDFALGVANESGGTAKHGGSDTFDVTNLRIFEDSDANGVLSGPDQLVTFVDNLAAGATRRLFVVGDVPSVPDNAAVANGAVAGIRLTATAREMGAARALGGAITVSATNTPAMETVFAEPAGRDTANDGIVINQDDYTVSAALLTMIKQSRVVSTSVGGLATALAIPGAQVEYCIRVRNATGGATATGVSVTDTLVAQLSYVASSLRVAGTTTVNPDASVTCNADGASASTVSGQTVTGAVGDIPAGQERTVLFRALIN